MYDVVRVPFLRVIAAILLVISASQVPAQTCPDFYRFVDFGLKGSDGGVYRGGPTFRAEGFGGQALLLASQTACLDVQDVAKDGRGNPIPVVTRIAYDPEETGIDLTELYVGVAEDIEALAENNARLHRDWQSESDAELTRGPNFLCVRSGTLGEISCQLESPYPGKAALVVYCDARDCTMPVMAISDRLHAIARWDSAESLMNDPHTLGASILDKVQSIHDFLEPLSSDL